MPTEKFREMIRLHELGCNQSEIAHSCHVARSTVQDYLRRAASKELSYERLGQMSDSEAQALLRYSQIWCTATKSGSLLTIANAPSVGLLNSQTILKLHPFNHIAKMLEATNSQPAFLSALD